MSKRMYVFVDCEGGPAPGIGGGLREFGAVIAHNRATFHGVIKLYTTRVTDPEKEREVFLDFNGWLTYHSKLYGRPVFVSDNPAYDWQFINEAFHRILRHNPFGHSARRIGDFYAGTMGDWAKTQEWKRYRITEHDHNPVNDAMGNLEAWERITSGN